MNLIKRIFIAIFFTAGFALFVYAIWYLINYGLQWNMLGVALASSQVLAFLAFLFFSNNARTSTDLLWLNIPILVGSMISFWPFDETANWQLALSTLVLCFGGSLLYTFWYSHFGREKNPDLTPGNVLPDRTIANTEGHIFKTSSLPTKYGLYMFYRGNWCPLCMAQIEELIAEYHILEKMGVSTFLISPQPEKNSASLARKFKVKFNFIADASHEWSKSLNLFHKNGLPGGLEVLGYDADTVLPTVLITDRLGKIIYSDQTNNYRVRPEPSAFINAIENFEDE